MHYNLGWALEKSGHIPEALAEYRSEVQLNAPNDPGVLAARARLKALTGQDS